MADHTGNGWAGCTAVERDPQHVNRAWVFLGTRIPVPALFENLEDGISLAEFVEHIHTLPTAYELGCSTITNGDLIRLAVQEGYELLLTSISWPRIRQVDRQSQPTVLVQMYASGVLHGCPVAPARGSRLRTAGSATAARCCISGQSATAAGARHWR